MTLNKRSMPEKIVKLIWFGIGSLVMGIFIISLLLIIPSNTTKNYYEGYGEGYDWGIYKAQKYCEESVVDFENCLELVTVCQKVAGITPKENYNYWLYAKAYDKSIK